MSSLLIIIIKTIRLYELILLVRIFLTWVPHDRSHPFINVLYLITDPLLDAAKRVFDAVLGVFKVDASNLQFDFSPMLAFLFIEVVVMRLVVLIFSAFI